MRVIYIADDGKEFDDKFDCERHEWELKHPHLKDIICYDEDGELLSNVMDDDTYNYSEKIIVPTKECVKELHDIAGYTGFSYYYHITEPGTWVFHKEQERFIKE